MSATARVRSPECAPRVLMDARRPALVSSHTGRAASDRASVWLLVGEEALERGEQRRLGAACARTVRANHAIPIAASTAAEVPSVTSPGALARS